MCHCAFSQKASRRFCAACRARSFSLEDIITARERDALEALENAPITDEARDALTHLTRTTLRKHYTINAD